jgi:hypothetical protein
VKQNKLVLDQSEELEGKEGELVAGDVELMEVAKTANGGRDFS